MSAHRPVLLLAAAAATAAALAAPAAAPAASTPKLHYRIFRVRAVTGSERVDFAGDAGAGCADHGVCGISGTETFTPDPPSPDAVAFVLSAGHTSLGTIAIGGATTATVTTAGAGAACTDRIEVDHTSVALANGPSGWSAELHGSGGIPGLADTDAGVFATHCAGPRVADLVAAKALARARFRRSALDRRTLSLDLVADRPFSGAGFAGHVTADVKVTLRRLPKSAGGLGASGTDVLPQRVG